MIRLVTPADYPALAAIGNAAFPGMPHDAEEMMEEDETKPPAKAARWVADVDGRLVGTASYYQQQSRYHPQKFWMDLFVHPEFQGRGIGTALYEQVLAALAPENLLSLRTFSREDLTHGVDFFLRRGFAEGKRTWRSFLDLTKIDLEAFARPLPAGVEIRTLAALKGEPGWVERLLALYNTVNIDVPDIDPAAAVECDAFRQWIEENPRLLPEHFYVALDGDRWVGTTSLWKSPTPGQVGTGITGVLREYRGRDIAWALKLKSLEAARAAGYTSVETQNASTNRPMLAINERLGFSKEPAWIHLVRTF